MNGTTTSAIDNAAAIQDEIRSVFRDLGNLLIQTAGATADPVTLNSMRPVIMAIFGDEYMETARRRLEQQFNQLTVAVSK